MIQQDASDMEVILNILAAGPDYVEKRMTDVRLSRGSGSPAVVRLIDLLSTAKEASSADGGKPVRDQHVVSHVLSGQFCEVVNPKDGLQLRRWNLTYMTNDLKTKIPVTSGEPPLDRQGTGLSPNPPRPHCLATGAGLGASSQAEAVFCSP
jgi:hypothetical protein